MSSGPVSRVVQEARAAGSSQVIQVAGDYYSGAVSHTAAMRTLPRDMAAFTGRESELAGLMKVAGQGRADMICTVDGMPGVGKTALVTRAAHLLAEQFPDGQLFVSLHAHTPGRRPADPSSVLASLLAGTGLGPGEIPVDLDARAQRWRDRLAGKKVLLVFDDVADSTQIEPLLPGTAGCLVLVTSRRRLVAFDGARPLSLDTMSPDQAAQLFICLAGRDASARSEARAVTQLVSLCGCLPLALVLLAGRLAHHPAWSITEFTADFAAARDRLGELTAGDRAVAAAFELSYQDLPAGRKRFFRHLGLHPGSGVDAYSAAALDGIAVPQARRHLEALYAGHLVDEPLPGRYRLHDLIALFAGTLAARDDPAGNREQAALRLLDYYQHTCQAADRHLSRHTRPGLAVPVVFSIAAPAMVTRADAQAWMRAERSNLLACIERAADPPDSRAVLLTAAMAAFLFQEGPWQLAATLHEAAAGIAHHGGDRLGEANSLHDLGGLLSRTGDYPAAAEILQRALAMYRDLGDRLGEANVLDDLSGVYYPTGDYPAAAGVLEQALRLYRDLGDRLGEANALDDLGRVLYMTGDYPSVAGLHEQALTLYRDLGSSAGEANCLWGLGRVRARMGDYLAAAGLLQQALALHRGLGSRHGEAYSLAYLGGVRARTGQISAAADLLEQAIRLHRDLGDQHGEAADLMELGGVQARTGDYAAAARLLEDAVHLYRNLGDPFGEAGGLAELGAVHSITGDYPAATGFLERAQATFCQLGSRHMTAASLHYLGRVRTKTADYPAAAELLEQALAVCRETGDRHAEAEILNSTGELTVKTAGPAEATVLYQESLRLARQVQSPLDEARALEGIARCEELTGKRRSAAAVLREATAIYQRVGAPEAKSAATVLAALESEIPGDDAQAAR